MLTTGESQHFGLIFFFFKTQSQNQAKMNETEETFELWPCGVAGRGERCWPHGFRWGLWLSVNVQSDKTYLYIFHYIAKKAHCKTIFWCTQNALPGNTIPFILMTLAERGWVLWLRPWTLGEQQGTESAGATLWSWQSKLCEGLDAQTALHNCTLLIYVVPEK